MARAKTNAFNKFFDKIYVISLFDQPEKWKKVEKQFNRRGIKAERFVAVDGRCKKQGIQGCKDKLRSFETSYNVSISNDSGYPLKELIPAASLTIGTILILREMVKNKWERVLICEDDIELAKNLETKFKQVVKELGDTSYDLLYLSCGNQCGIHNLGSKKTKRIKYESMLNEHYDLGLWVADERDLRIECDGCKPISKHITKVVRPGGTWFYSYSLKGARKLLKMLDNDAGNHIDQIIKDFTEAGKLKCLAVDPPIGWHQKGREGSSMEWQW